ncbi:MAG: DUF2156 domain-containing protein [Candidatus Fibromonas sp.]|jgi:hypothetical protein|nr:DUF2156 domain-containing protein [Candidatus Fibromonas sp.]
MPIPLYPGFTPVNLNLQQQIQDIILKSKTGISSFAFANIYLFRNKYNFKVSLLENSLLITGERDGKTFFSILGNLPHKEILTGLLEQHDYWKGISEEQAMLLPGEMRSEDQNNFEYLYLRTDLAELPGKDFQKKRNLVNAFLKAYPQEERKNLPIEKETVKDAMQVLEEWKHGKGEHGDYDSAKEALELHEVLGLSGMVFYVKDAPAGYCQGETLADGKSFAVHFEKASDRYKGIYQYMNQEFAKIIPPDIRYINREQDLGNTGLRQAKMTYRPIDFVKLFSTSVSTRAE